MTTPSREGIDAGRRRLESLMASFDDRLIEAIGQATFAERTEGQPWLLAGVSDGMGLHVTLAALKAGVLRHGVGVYWEPPALLQVEDGEPVSPVHWARYQNALALEELAEEMGAEFEVLSADVMMNPQRGLKGDIKGEIPDFPDEVREAVEHVRRSAPKDDLVFIDSVAFGKWMCPREGMDPVEVPSVDFEGRVVQTKTKKFHPRGYNETLDTMGRNHGRLLETFKDFGWFGTDTTTAFFTWAGGSQNVEVLEGIYGRGALGDAKLVAEKDVAEFRLEHGLELGSHAIVRLPAFLSAALMAIPGGGLFGLVSREVMERRGVYRDMPELSARMVRRLFDKEWVRENPIAQIELDSHESLYLSEISDQVEQAHERIASYRADHPDADPEDPIPLEESEALLDGLVPDDYVEILGRFRPDEDAGEVRGTFTYDGARLGDSGSAPAASTLAAAMGAASEAVSEWAGGRDIVGVEDRVTLQSGWTPEQGPRDGTWTLRTLGRKAVLRRELKDAHGTTLVSGRTTLSVVDGELGVDLDVDRDIGEAAGWRLTVDDRPLSQRYWPGFADDDALWNGLATAAFGEDAIRRARETGDDTEMTVSSAWRRDRVPQRGDRILTYVHRDGSRHVGRVLDDQARARSLVQVDYRE